MAIETITLSALSGVIGAPADNTDATSLEVASRMLAKLAWNESTLPPAGAPFPLDWQVSHVYDTSKPAQAPTKRPRGPLPFGGDYHGFRVAQLANQKYAIEHGPFGVAVWMLRIDAGETLPALIIRRHSGTTYVNDYRTSRQLMTAARIRGLPSLECDVTDYP